MTRGQVAVVHRRTPGYCGHELNIGQAAWCDRSDEVIEPVVKRGRQRRHPPGQDWLDAGPDRLAYMVIDMALIVQVLDMSLSSAQKHM